MKKKRPSGKKASKPPPERGSPPRGTGARGATSRRPGASRTPRPPRAQLSAPGAETTLEYKVVELSTVDEGSIERTLNQWTRQGWNLDGLQFAMRESSKRPAMAFVFFTREAAVKPEQAEAEAARDGGEARDHLARLAGVSSAGRYGGGEVPRVDPHTRLAQLAGVVPDPNDPMPPSERESSLDPGDGFPDRNELDLDDDGGIAS